MSIGRPFQKGMARPPGAGRVKGTRNKISEAFLKDLALEWEKSGPDALKVMAKEDCSGFVKVVAALLPKELDITHNQLADMDDSELEILINELRGKLRTAIIRDTGSGEGQTAH